MRTGTRATGTRRLLAIGVAGALLLPSAAAGAPVRAVARIAPQQDLVTLLHAQAAFERPDATATQVGSVAAKRPITGAATTLPVLRRSTDAHGTVWLSVRLPGRVIGTVAPSATGWIKAARTRPSTTPWHIVVQLAARRVSVYEDGHKVRTYSAVVGKPSTPTPRGDYFIEENVRMPASAPGFPFALATSARSDVLQEFEGGPGQIALHGVGNVGGTMGTAVSHGCVRMTNRSIRWLALRIAPGVPLTIR
ncbi:MAG: hypothetical protein QOH13_606 [Thermoleophilaceae bacterium]|nr:hypothetical protein [Thermoleophilaceae bacterium]